MDTSDDSWLSVKETGEKLGYSGTTIRRWIKAGMFPGAFQGPRETSAFRIPLAAVEDFLRTRQQASGQSKIPTPHSHRVMLIDDDPDDIAIITNVLRKMSLEPVVVQSGGSAVTWIESVRPDLVILDLRLPVVSGKAILECIRSDPELERTPVIVITAYPDLLEQQPVGQLADRVLIKSFPITILERYVAQFTSGL